MKNIQLKVLISIVFVLLCLSGSPALAAPIIKLTATKGTCPASGSIKVTATGTTGTVYYAIKLTTDTEFSLQQENDMFLNLASGIYVATVYDGAGSYISSPITLTNANPTPFKLNTPAAGNLYPTACADDGSISISANDKTGVKPYTYHLKDGPTPHSDITLSTGTAQFLQLSTGIYNVDVTDGCGTTLTSNAISVTSKYNISGRDLDVFELNGTTAWDVDTESTCGISFTRSAGNVYLKDVNGDTLFRRSWNKEMPGNYPVEGRVEYPEGSGNYTPWGPITKYYLPASIYKPSINKFRLQLKNPCDPTDIVTSASIYTLVYPYDVRQSTCGWEIYRLIKNYHCGNIDIELSLSTNPSQKYTYTWDGMGDFYKLDLGNIPQGTYIVRITTAGDTYQPTTKIVVSDNTVLKVDIRADIYNYTRGRGCDFFTGGIRAQDIPTGNTVPITYSILSGPVTRDPVTSIGNGLLWEDLPSGIYRVEANFGDCGRSVTTTELKIPFSGFNADELAYIPGSSCGKYKITGKGWYLAPDSSISTATTEYGASVFNATTGALISAFAGGVASNTPFTGTVDLDPGTYRVSFSSHQPTESTCRYLDRYITIPPYAPMAIDISKSGGSVCTNGFGELHITTTGGSGQTVTYRIRPAASQDNNDYTPYQSSPDFPNISAGEYTVQIKDDCGLIITQNLNLISTATTAKLVVSGADIPSGEVTEICPRTDVSLALKITGKATNIKWKFPNGTEIYAETISISDFSSENEGTYYATYTSGGCIWENSVTLHIKPNRPDFSYNSTSILCPSEILNLKVLTPSNGSVENLIMTYWNDDYTQNITATANAISTAGIYHIVGTNQYGCSDSSSVKVNVPPVTTTWIAKGNANDWNDEANWDNGIPASCSNVIIPDQSSFTDVATPHYPILQPGSDTYLSATCDTILFKMGGEVAKTNYLTYNFAKVDLTLQPNQWYTVAPALQQQYSGDYLEDLSKFRLNPEIFIMYYQTGNPEKQTAKISSKFTGFFNNTDELLKINSGQAIWVDNGTRTDSEFTIHFPKDSLQYSYYDQSNNITRASGVMQRDKRGRFIYEGNSTYLSGGDGSFAQMIENSDSYPQLIIGNPFMSHFDIVKFQDKNNSYLEKSFRIWKGNSYETYLINGDGTVVSTSGDEDGFQIPSMQSFIIDTKGLFSDPLLFTPEMSITRPGHTLRSTSQDHLTSNVIQVAILREGARQSGIAVRYKMGASRHYSKDKDVWTAIPQSVGNHVSLHALIDGGAASIYTTGDVNAPIDLGISVGSSLKKEINAGKRDTYTIQIDGNENHLAGKEVFLSDTKKNISHNLSRSSYHFENTTGDISGRFQLFVKNGVQHTGIDENVLDSNIRIAQTNGQLKVNTIGNPIWEISIFNVLGQLLYSFKNLDTADWSSNILLENQVVIIKVKAQKGIKVQKIMLK